MWCSSTVFLSFFVTTGLKPQISRWTLVRSQGCLGKPLAALYSLKVMDRKREMHEVNIRCYIVLYFYVHKHTHVYI